MQSFEMLINGAWVAAGDGASFDTVSPADGKVWAKIPEATEEDVDRRCALRTPPATRGRGRR